MRDTATLGHSKQEDDDAHCIFNNILCPYQLWSEYGWPGHKHGWTWRSNERNSICYEHVWWCWWKLWKEMFTRWVLTSDSDWWWLYCIICMLCIPIYPSTTATHRQACIVLITCLSLFPSSHTIHACPCCNCCAVTRVIHSTEAMLSDSTWHFGRSTALYKLNCRNTVSEWLRPWKSQ